MNLTWGSRSASSVTATCPTCASASDSVMRTRASDGTSGWLGALCMFQGAQLLSTPQGVIGNQSLATHGASSRSCCLAHGRIDRPLPLPGVRRLCAAFTRNMY